jgi:hypothetical protein
MPGCPPGGDLLLNPGNSLSQNKNHGGACPAAACVSCCPGGPRVLLTRGCTTTIQGRRAGAVRCALVNRGGAAGGGGGGGCACLPPLPSGRTDCRLNGLRTPMAAPCPATPSPPPCPSPTQVDMKVNRLTSATSLSYDFYHLPFCKVSTLGVAACHVAACSAWGRPPGCAPPGGPRPATHLRWCSYNTAIAGVGVCARPRVRVGLPELGRCWASRPPCNCRVGLPLCVRVRAVACLLPVWRLLARAARGWRQKRRREPGRAPVRGRHPELCVQGGPGWAARFRCCSLPAAAT